jgi:hypothetical protein
MKFTGIEVYNLFKFPALTDRGGPFHKHKIAATVRHLKDLKLSIPCMDTSMDLSENSANAMRNAAIALDNALIDAFSSADPGIRVRVSDSERRRRIAKGQLAPNTGELRVENKFYVLTASRYHEDSYGFESYSDSYNYFTKWLTDGIGTSGRMPADANYDNETTLSELFNYISRVGDNYPFNFAEGTFYQHVQVYPKNSPYGLFRR